MSNYTKMAALMGSSAIIVGGGAATADTDWSGAYAGASFSLLGGNIVFPGPTYPIYSDLFSGGGFVGFNWSAGNGLVLGAEVAAPGSFASGPIVYGELFDAKIRVGTALGDALFYGIAGSSSGVYSETNEWDTYAVSLSGFGYGVGIDYAINDNAFAGIEYFARNMEGEGYSTDPLSTISLRLGVLF